jgi:hypothetical protein
MDDELIRFRRAAERENRGRRAIRRRYSPTLQHQAVDYCHSRRQQGEGVRTIAAALGIAPWSLHRWTRRLTARPRFRPIELIARRFSCKRRCPCRSESNTSSSSQGCG